MNISSIILAGGKSKRMGANKALISFHGKPLISYSIDLALFYTRTVLLSANSQDLDHLEFPVIRDIYPVGAPIAGIHAGLRASSTDWNLVLTCDMPNVTKVLIDMMLAALNNDLRMVVPTHDGYLEPLCGFYHRGMIPLMERHIETGKLSPLDLPGSVPHRFVTMDQIPPGDVVNIFMNVNERKDLVT